MSSTSLPIHSPDNARRLLMAGFCAILAAGVGFGVRGGIFANWGADFGFTGGQLGAIGGAGFSGFCFGIIIAGVIVDKLGYGKLIAAAFLLHVLSAFVTFCATPADPAASDAVKAAASTSAYHFLYWGMFLFALGNGVLEGVANPLVSTLYPHKRTHYLNILHASWPAGLVIGGLIGWTLGEQGVSWKIQLSLYLIPTVLYGVLFFRQTFPQSDAVLKGLPLSEMLKDIGLLGAAVACYLLVLFFQGALGFPSALAFALGGVLLVVVGVLTRFAIGSFLLFTLFIAHALVGSVELGTDSWIQNITGNILTPDEGKLLFVFTSAVMFSLRFCAHFIEKYLKLSPIGLLLICACLATIGLNLASGITTFAGALLALFVYALGKTFFWPTMLAVVGDRFPRSGAIAMSLMGGIGMMSVGMIGGPGLGYAKDRFAGEALQSTSAQTYAANKAETPSEFLTFTPAYGLDGTKLAAAQKAVSDYHTQEKDRALGLPINGPISSLHAEPSTADRAVVAASIAGDRKTLVADSAIPAAMALIYLLIFIYFKTIGGYKAVRIEN